MNLVAGIVAHVDSGKTTLAEGIMYKCGKIKSPGRVDHGDCLLDNYAIERKRGITVFAKEAECSYGGVDFTFLDTPGHVDFSAETERTFSVLDVAILVIGCKDSIAGHTKTLWKLLKSYNIPTFIFVNKMDLAGADKDTFFEILTNELSDNIIDFSSMPDWSSGTLENMSLCDEGLLDEYTLTDSLTKESISDAIGRRKIFPCIFGSALKNEGIDTLLSAISKYMPAPVYIDEFSARVFRVARDGAARLSFVKITGGYLQVKDTVHTDAGEVKINEIRKYNGASFKAVSRVEAGEVCALVGPDSVKAGDVIGAEGKSFNPILVPVMAVKIAGHEEEDLSACYKNIQILSEELPELNVGFDEVNREINIYIMGDVQLEILASLYHERYGSNITFSEGSIVYRETIASCVHGIGHYEPLKHYAEVHLMLEPGEPGSGVTVSSVVSTDDLDYNWQKHIMTHVEEKQHIGVLTGAAVTDVKITVIGGKAHNKHTMGGDFRQATYRAVRQGLMQAESVLLEPFMHFELELPTTLIGRAMSDVRKYHGTIETNVCNGEMSLLTGNAPMKDMMSYGREVNAYSKGYGHFTFEVSGYMPCHNSDEIIDAAKYNPETDIANPAYSVFCSHGAGVNINWNEVKDYAHVQCDDIFDRLSASEMTNQAADNIEVKSYKPKEKTSGRVQSISIEEIEEIYKTTYRQSKEDFSPIRYSKYEQVHKKSVEKEYVYKPIERKEKYLLVDGYNVIFSWPELRDIARDNLEGARDVLIRECSNYQGSTGYTVIVVYDAYKVKGNPGSIEKYDNIYVVYTKEAETADSYIEKTVHKLAKKHDIIVATSDGLEQMIIYGEGAVRMTSLELMSEMERERNRLSLEGYVDRGGYEHEYK